MVDGCPRVSGMGRLLSCRLAGAQAGRCFSTHSTCLSVPSLSRFHAVTGHELSCNAVFTLPQPLICTNIRLGALVEPGLAGDR